MVETIFSKDAIPGCWYEFRGLRLLFVVVINGAPRFANRFGVCESFSPDLRVTPLPDCTGWDWQPTKPSHPTIPNGWRLLENSETKEYGDMFWTVFGWQDSDPCGGKADTAYIRRIAPQYRPFANAAEFALHRGRWMINIGTGTIRRVDHYSDKGVNGVDWETARRKWTFDDGSPFGVKVTG